MIIFEGIILLANMEIKFLFTGSVGFTILNTQVRKTLIRFFVSLQFNLLFGWSVSDYRTFFSSVVAVVGLLIGIVRHEEVKSSSSTITAGTWVLRITQDVSRHYSIW